MAAWRAARDRDVWSNLERDARVVGVPLRDNLGRDVGSLALRYSREFFDDSVAAQSTRLSLIGAIVVLGNGSVDHTGRHGSVARPARASFAS